MRGPGIARLIPAKLRAPLLRVATRVLLPTARPSWVTPAYGKVTIAGLFTSPSGIGEGARLRAEQLASLGYTVGTIDLTRLLRWPEGLSYALREVVAGDVGGPLIVDLNPPFFQVALLRHLRHLLQGRKIIGYWAWELTEVPPSWRSAFRLVHEIWVPSSFVAAALVRAGCQQPIRVVRPPLPIPSCESVTATVPGLTVLTVFAYDSGFDRKNPTGAIAAFREAFGDDPAATLLVKARGRSPSGRAELRLQTALAGVTNVRLLYGDFSRDAYHRLLSSADVLLSLHRSEGLGLPLAEAMLRNKPVVATGWSGNLDFMDESSACLVPAKLIPVVDEAEVYRGLGGTWADPSIQVAASWLRRLRDPALREHIGRSARERASVWFGPAEFAATVRPSLEDGGGRD